MLKTDSPIKTHLKSILGGQIVAQQAAAYQTTQEITEYAKKHDYNLSFTGYSLGAWFAELSLYFAYQDFNYFKAKAITFDSPGSAKIMDSFKPNIISYKTHFDIRNLDITTYLSAPNFVNTSNHHIHKAYRLFPKVTAAEYSNKIINALNKAIPIKNYISLLSLNSDLLDSMLDSFDSKTGKPIKYEQIIDWPCIKYEPKDNTLGGKLIDSMPIGGVIKDLAKRGITATTLGSFLEVFDHFISGNVAIEQILEFYKHLEDPTQAEGKKQFELFYEGHYKSQKVNLSEDVVNVNDIGSSDYYLKQLTKLSNKEIDKKEIPNLVKQQLKIIKDQYKIKLQNKKYYIFTNSLSIKVDDLKEQILRLIEVSYEAKEVLENLNAYNSHELIESIKNINSNLSSLLPYNLIRREDILQDIEKNLNEKQFITISGYTGIGKSTLAIEYGREQRDKAKKIVHFINADSAYKITEAYIQFAKEFSIYTTGEKEEDITRLIHENIAKLNSNTLFIFDNVEVYKDIEPYLNSMMSILKDKVQVIITTKNNKLSDDITNIELKPFNIKTAVTYLENSLGNRFNDEDINDLIEELGNKDEILPYSLSKAVAYLKENKLLKVKDYLNFLRNNKDKQPETILLLEILEKSSLAWLILQYSACLDPDFISIDIFKELFLLDEEKLQEPIKKLEALSLMKLIYQDGQAGLQLHGLVQFAVKRYVDRHKEHAIDEQKIYISLAEALDSLFPILIDVPNEDWEASKLFYPHVIKILNVNIEINKFIKANLYQKIGYYSDGVLHRFKESLKYHKEALKIFQKLYQGNHSDIAKSLNNIGVAYNNLGDIFKGLKYLRKALKMNQALYQGNHPAIANSLNNIGAAYNTLGDIAKGLEYYEKALKMNQTLYQGNNLYIAISLNNVGEAYRNLGNTTKALIYHQKALKIFQVLYQNNHHYIAAALNNVGQVYQDSEDNFKGLQYLEEALKMFQKLYQGNHPCIATSLNNVGLACRDLGDNSKGLQYLEEALKMFQELYPSNHSYIAALLNSIGLSYKDLGNPAKALIYYKGALEIYQTLYQDNPLHIVSMLNTFNSIGAAYYKLGNTSEGLKYLKYVLEMYKALYQNNNPYIASALNNVGEAYKVLGNISKGLEYLEEALNMNQKLYKCNHSSIAGSLDNVSLAYEKFKGY
ncbi:tetratricopeptide repeat protein [Rickettsia bellii]|uniref:TPR repeat family protein n=1 Tax=Rickettsia bellii str. RML An4 TaxID=1359193 RepID=A0A0F3QAT4_RICBE|nr:tetratricopeptide repeat protein [Rickettsia bellii]KJV89685.1 TPR repeat family protein [Rickettsia bellii str. RML An4]